MRVVLCVIIIWVFLFHTGVQAEEGAPESGPIGLFVKQLFDNRAELLVHTDKVKIKPLYLLSERKGIAAMEHEWQRAEYLKKWAEKRRLTFTEASNVIRITKIRMQGDSAFVSAIQSLQLKYMYNSEPRSIHIFGLGTRNALRLKKTNDGWKVASEWYLDPLEIDPKLIPVNRNYQEASVVQTWKRAQKVYFNRQRALDYANKYAGSGWGSGNEGRYNPSYFDYTYEGGDCTNFVSQVLGDPLEGGGLPMTDQWRHKGRKDNTVAWIRTDSFKNFLLQSGYGRLIARGTYAEVAKPSAKFPQSAFHNMQPGDVIGYEVHGDIDHFAVFVGFDDRGYPLVNCHTTDRYHVPFDLGWESYTKYLLIHIKD